MSDPVAEFLAKQKRYVCDRLSASLTIEQCEQNRTRAGNAHKGINNVMACEGCAGLGKAIEIEERVMAKGERACKECGEVKKIHSYGTCAKCLYKLYGKAMKPPVIEASPVASPPPAAEQLEEQQPGPAIMSLLHPAPTLSMVLDFSNDADIYRQLIEKGVDEDQIIGLLSMLLDGELRRVA